MKLLHIDSSILGGASATRMLTKDIVARFKAAHPGTEVTYLDLAAEELPHLSPKSLAQSDESEGARGTQALEQFLAADAVVIGAPIYNFSIPSQLKAWIDRITVAGRTFRYTAQGPEGLAGDKEIIVAMARGGTRAAADQGQFSDSYLRFLFGFLGIRNVRFVHAEGLSLSAEHREASLAAARAEIAAVQTLAA